jgi:hypothetical protein
MPSQVFLSFFLSTQKMTGATGEDLQTDASNFANVAERLRHKMWWKHVKENIILIIVIVFIVYSIYSLMSALLSALRC